MEYTTLYVTLNGKLIAIDFIEAKNVRQFDLNQYADCGWKVISVVATDYHTSDILVYVLERELQGIDQS